LHTAEFNFLAYCRGVLVAVCFHRNNAMGGNNLQSDDLHRMDITCDVVLVRNGMPISGLWGIAILIVNS
jgi:hypothetical protein